MAPMTVTTWGCAMAPMSVTIVLTAPKSGGSMRTVGPERPDMRAVTHDPGPFGALHPRCSFSAGSVVTAFLLSLGPAFNRGHHPPLDAVEATNSDKRGESGLCLLGEHPSGQRKLEPSGW